MKSSVIKRLLSLIALVGFCLIWVIEALYGLSNSSLMNFVSRQEAGWLLDMIAGKNIFTAIVIILIVMSMFIFKVATNKRSTAVLCLGSFAVCMLIANYAGFNMGAGLSISSWLFFSFMFLQSLRHEKITVTYERIDFSLILVYCLTGAIISAIYAFLGLFEGYYILTAWNQFSVVVEATCLSMVFSAFIAFFVVLAVFFMHKIRKWISNYIVTAVFVLLAVSIMAMASWIGLWAILYRLGLADLQYKLIISYGFFCFFISIWLLKHVSFKLKEDAFSMFCIIQMFVIAWLPLSFIVMVKGKLSLRDFVFAALLSLLVLFSFSINPFYDWLQVFSSARLFVGWQIISCATVLLYKNRSFAPIEITKILATCFVAICGFLIASIGLSLRMPAAHAALVDFNRLSRIHYVASIRTLTANTGVFSLFPEHEMLSINNMDNRLEKVVLEKCNKDFNIVIIIVEALRNKATKLTGYSRNTAPEFDKILKDFYVFENAHSEFNGTISSVPSFLAGKRWFYKGDKKEILSPSENLIDMFARNTGNHKIIIARPPVSSEDNVDTTYFSSFKQFFDGEHTKFVIGENHFSSKLFDALLKGIDTLDSKERFIGFTHIMDTHQIYEKKANAVDYGDGFRDLYDNNVNFFSSQFSRLVKELKKRGKYKNTAFLVFGDHGEQFFEHGWVSHGFSLYEEDIRIFLAARIPEQEGGFIKGRIALTQALPMFFKELGCLVYGDAVKDIPKMTKLKNGTNPRPYETAFGTYTPCFMLFSADKKLKLIHNPVRQSWKLFDLSNDEMEKNNLIGDREMLKKAKFMMNDFYSRSYKQRF